MEKVRNTKAKEKTQFFYVFTQMQFDNPQHPITFTPQGTREPWEWYGPSNTPPLRYQGLAYEKAIKRGDVWLVYRTIDSQTQERIEIYPQHSGVNITIRQNTVPGYFDDWELVEMYFAPFTTEIKL